MKLNTIDAEYFNNLFTMFLLHVNNELKIIDNFNDIKDLKYLKTNQQLELRKKIYENMSEYVDSYLEKGNLTLEDKEIVKSWKLFIYSTFIIYKHLKYHTVFIDTKTSKAYGVLALLDDLNVVVPDDYLPLVIKTTLLPFKGKIIYDGMIEGAKAEGIDLMDNVALEVGYQGLKEANEMTVSMNEKYFDKQYSYNENVNIWEENSYSYVDGTFIRNNEKIGRNDPCSCGSGKKYKKCCGN